MTAATDTDEKTTAKQTGYYIYGIVPGDTEIDADVKGVGDPANSLELVRHDDVAALVSEVRTDRPLGRPDDLVAHERLLDAAIAEAPVLPIRFGAVVTDKTAVVDELLAPHHDEFAAALDELEGLAEYVVKARYVETAVLGEIVSENRDAARLRDEIRDQPEAASRNHRIRLGELINNEIATRRDQDTDRLVDALQPLAEHTLIREPAHELDAAHLALLVRLDRQDQIESVLDEFAEQWDGRITLRLLGPLAPYDFVSTGNQTG